MVYFRPWGGMFGMWGMCVRKTGWKKPKLARKTEILFSFFYFGDELSDDVFCGELPELAFITAF